MKAKIGKGVSDFKKLREQENYYIDKSLMIKDVINDNSDVVLIPRPRRFGKTLNMSMLRYFFDSVEQDGNRQLFEGLQIEQEEVFDLHQGKYPVIYLSLKDIKQSSFSASFESLQELVSEEYARFNFLIKSGSLEEHDLKYYHDVLHCRSSQAQLEISLKRLSQYLFKHFKKKPLILIDEYDTPIHAAFTEGYYKEMIDFMRLFLGAALKDNTALYKGVLTGTLRISRESIFTGLNNLSVYTILNSEYNTYFGFTPEELTQMLAYYGLENMEDEVKRWYNGYIFGAQEIYNPWSIINFVASADRKFIPHWVNTSSNDLIKEIIKESPFSVQSEFEDLLSGKCLIKDLDENISFPELRSSDRSIYSFLVFSGYLKARFKKHTDDADYYELSIPNIEVKRLFKNIILSWFKETFKQGKSAAMINALLDKDIELFGELLEECVLQSLSVHDVEKREVERVYQAFLLGMLVSLSPDYEVSSNRGSGYGRYDICVIPLKSKKTCVIMELKSLRIRETYEDALASALKQIEDRQYETAVRQRGYDDILKLAVVFDGKRVWVRS